MLKNALLVMVSLGTLATVTPAMANEVSFESEIQSQVNGYNVTFVATPTRTFQQLGNGLEWGGKNRWSLVSIYRDTPRSVVRLHEVQ